jgi:hypothetical protein
MIRACGQCALLLVALPSCGEGVPTEGEVWLSSTGGGTVSAPWHLGNCFDGSYCDSNTFKLSTTFTATPDPGQTFHGWSGICTGADVECMARLTPYIEDNWLVATFGPAYPVWARPIDYDGEAFRPRQDVAGVLGSNGLGYVAGSAGQGYLEAFDDTGAFVSRLAVVAAGETFDVTSIAPGGLETPILAGGIFGGGVTIGDLEIEPPPAETVAGLVVAATPELNAMAVWEFRAVAMARVEGVAYSDRVVAVGSHDGLVAPLILPADAGGVDVFVASLGPEDSWEALSLGSSGRDQALGVAIGSAGEILLVANFTGAVSTAAGDLPAGQSLLAIEGGDVVAAVHLGGAPTNQVIPRAGVVALADGGVAIGLGYEGDTGVGPPHQRDRVSGLVAVLDRDGTAFAPRWVVHLDSDERALIQSLAVRGDSLYAAGRVVGRLELNDMQVASQGGAGLLVGFDLADGHARWLRRVGGVAGAIVGAGAADVDLWVGAGGVDELPRNLGPDLPMPIEFGWNLGPYLLRFEDESNP